MYCIITLARTAEVSEPLITPLISYMHTKRSLLKLFRDVVSNEVPAVCRGPSIPPSDQISSLVSVGAPTSVGWLASQSSSDLQIRRRHCRDGCVHTSTFDDFDVVNHRPPFDGGSWLRSYSRGHSCHSRSMFFIPETGIAARSASTSFGASFGS